MSKYNDTLMWQLHRALTSWSCDMTEFAREKRLRYATLCTKYNAWLRGEWGSFNERLSA